MEIKLIVGVKLLCVILLIVDNCRAIRWLALHHSSLPWNVTSLTSRVLCGQARSRFGLGRRQARLCKESLETMPHVTAAATAAVDTCSMLFQSRRWNCSSARKAPELPPDLTRGTREQAYTYALASASLTHSISRACASGALYQCTCSIPPREPPRQDFKWGGCGDNVRWAEHFAKQFTDSADRHLVASGEHQQQVVGAEGGKGGVKTVKMVKKTVKKTVKVVKMVKVGEEKAERKKKRLEVQIALMNLHNNRVGRRLIEQSLTIQCKCHGVSGSCNIKTCWRALPPMAEVGARLQRRFAGAVEVVGRRLQPAAAAHSHRHAPTPDQLIFVTKSPDYCTRDERLGSLGTQGRICNVSSSGTDSCRYMCCGRGYRTVVEEKIERCHCKYYWCCYVKCKTCRTLIQTHECN